MSHVNQLELNSKKCKKVTLARKANLINFQ